MNKEELKSKINRLKRAIKNLLIELDEKDVDTTVIMIFTYLYCYDRVEKDFMVRAEEVMGYPLDEIFLSLVELEKEKLKNEQTGNCAIC